MSEPFLGEMKIVGFNFAPRGWAFTDGQILPINQNQSLYSLLGTTYGGDGRTSFALPDLRSRTSESFGSGSGVQPRTLGQKGGEETVTLTSSTMPIHNHGIFASPADGNQSAPTNHFIANANVSQFGVEEFVPSAGAGVVSMGSQMITNAGGGQAHTNIQPFIVLNFTIALQGLFPSRN